MTLDPAYFSVFSERFLAACERWILEGWQEADVLYDGFLPKEARNRGWFEQLYLTHPFGQGFEEPVVLAAY